MRLSLFCLPPTMRPPWRKPKSNTRKTLLRPSMSNSLCTMTWGSWAAMTPRSPTGWSSPGRGGPPAYFQRSCLDKFPPPRTSEDITHSYPHCWRCKHPIIFRATPQWFCSVESFKDEAVAAVDHVRWIPGWGRERNTVAEALVHGLPLAVDGPAVGNAFLEGRALPQSADCGKQGRLEPPAVLVQSLHINGSGPEILVFPHRSEVGGSGGGCEKIWRGYDPALGRFRRLSRGCALLGQYL